MELNPAVCYQAVLAHDPRFDGAFFFGVSTTGIYCRPVCSAKTPRSENCAFYPSAAAAERAGYRPCLRCRPELAPGNAHVDAVARLAATAASRIEDGALTDKSLVDLAAELGVSDRHLRRVVQAELGVSPVELAQTHRLLLAKRLLTDTDLPITDIAFASGFSSLRRFNALIQERYRLSPGQVRRARAAGRAPDTLACEVAYRAPLDWEALTAFLRARAPAGVEAIEDGRYMRTVVLGKRKGWIAVEPSGDRFVLNVNLSSSLTRALIPSLARVKRLFDLAADPQQIAARLGDIAAARPGLRVPGAFDGFQVAVCTVLGQQVSVQAARTLAGRFVAKFGAPIETPFPTLTHLFPTPERVANAEASEIAALGILAKKAISILAIAKSLTEGSVSLEPGGDVARTMVRLQELPGVGVWSAQCIAMRALSWPDAFPHTDLWIRRALGEPRSDRVLTLAEQWRPWRAYAAMHLWTSLKEVKVR